MSAIYILERIEQLDSIYKQIELDQSEESMLDRESYERFRESLLSILEIRKQPLYEKSRYLSNRMDPKKLSAEQYREFYDHCGIFEESANHITAKMKQLIGLDVPVLELFPGNGQFTFGCVAAEPLYIADYYLKNLDHVGNQFNDFYSSRRLVKLKIDDFDLGSLPNDQIGLAISFSYFIVKDKEFIVNWAREIFRVLRPGGTFIFNFIPGNYSSGIYMVERNSLTIVDTPELIQDLEDIGYIVDDVAIQKGYGSTVSIRKPGELNRIKMSSSVAKIIDKSEPLV